MYGFESQPTGYYVTFRNVMGLKGYVIVSFISGETPIVEFSFESDGLVGEYLEKNQEDYSMIMRRSAEQEKRLIFTGPDSFYIPRGNDTYYSIIEQETISVTEPQVSVCSTVSDNSGIIDWSQANLDTSTVYKIPGFGKGSDYWVRTDFKPDDPNNPNEEKPKICCLIRQGINITFGLLRILTELMVLHYLIKQ